MEERECLACGESFVPCRTVKHQKYCSKRECQRERKRRWERDKLVDDPDYSKNKRNSQKKWRERNPDYWRNYRRDHGGYERKNRERQRERNVLRRIRSRVIAKTDEFNSALGAVVIPCELIILRRDLVAKTDEIRAALRLVSRPSLDVGG